MYITIDDISKDINLEKPIDNTKNDRKIGLFRAYFVYTFYNIEKDEKIYLNNGRAINVKKGLYSIEDVKDISNNRVDYNKLTGKSVVDSSIKNFDYYLNNILGLNNENYVNILLSKKSLNFSTNILSTTDNLHNGIPSNNIYTGFVSNGHFVW